MSKDTLIEKFKSPIIRNELIKCLKGLDLKPLAKIIHDLLDVQLTDEDVKICKVEIANLLEQVKTELLK